jgi:hypothetical protein
MQVQSFQGGHGDRGFPNGLRAAPPLLVSSVQGDFEHRAFFDHLDMLEQVLVGRDRGSERVALGDLYLKWCVDLDRGEICDLHFPCGGFPRPLNCILFRVVRRRFVAALGLRGRGGFRTLDDRLGGLGPVDQATHTHAKGDHPE